MRKFRRHYLLVSMLTMLVLALVFTFGPAAAALPPTTPQQELEGVWALAARLGDFSYQTRLEQTTQPLPTLENVGLGSSVETIYIEGHNDLSDNALSMRIWTDGRSPLDDDNALEIKVENGLTRGRIGDGQWQEVDDISQFIAPGRDNLGFLAAAANTQLAGKETRAGITFDRYTFDLDGEAFARYMRQQMEAELARRGALPPGVELGASDQYRQMSGQGEFWVDGRGLPLRLVTDITLPADDLEQTSMLITTDFSAWDQSLAAQAATWHGRLAMNAPNMIRQGAIGLGAVSAGLFMLVAAAALWQRIGWKRFYRTTIVLLIPIMVLSPLLQPLSADAAFDRFEAFQARQTELQAASESARAERAANNGAEVTDFNPQQDPLAAFNANGEPDRILGADDLIVENSLTGVQASPAAQTQTTLEVDTDGDQLTDATEALLCTDPNNPDTDGDGLSDGAELDPRTPLTDPCASDTDGDGLSDRVELLELGTDPKDIDTDGDLISDKTEVQGFSNGSGGRLYLNALSWDTNLDSRSDGAECAALVDVKIGADGLTAEFITENRPTIATTCSDVDGDGTPDAMDRDDDGDGVLDKVDSDPTTAVTGGKRAQNTCVNDYDCLLGISGNKFKLQLSDYNTDLPLLVDFQMRPESPDHLQYMLHVLDWPDNDNKGQITTGSGNTFGKSGRDANGDLRLFPLLEIKIPSEKFTYPTLPKVANPPSEISATTPITAWLDITPFDEFGIFLRQNDAVSGDLLAYVPLNMIEDPISGDPVAFNGRMVYEPDSSTWGSDHTARLVWMVEVINGDGVSQFVHVYEDEWLLTGLTVREDHGVDVAIAYEDPVFAQAQTGYDATTYTEQNLWQLADGLSNSFILGRTDSNGDRDITVAEIARRWDKATNSGNGLSNGDDELWDIPKDALFVHTQTLAHQGQLGLIPAEINKILTGTFTTVASQNVVTATVVSIAREEKVRLAGLATSGVQTGSSGAVSLLNVQQEHYVASQMAAYKYDSGWKPFEANSYWESYFRPRMQSDLDLAHRALLGAEVSPETRLGFYAYAYSAFITQFAGLNNLVQRGLTVYENKLSVPDGVLAIGQFTPTNIGKFATTAVRYINIGASWAYTNDTITFFKAGSKDVRFVINKLKITSLADLNDYIARVDSGPVVDALDQYKRLNVWKKLVVDDTIAGNHLASVAGGIKSGRGLSFLQGLIYTKVTNEVEIGIKKIPPPQGASRIVFGNSSNSDPVMVKVQGSVLNKKALTALAIGSALVLGTIAAISFSVGDSFFESGLIAFNIVSALNDSITIFHSTQQFYAAAKGINGAKGFLGFINRVGKTTTLLKSQLSQMTRISIGIGTVLEVVVAVGLFIGLMVSSGLDLFSRLGLRATFDLVGAISVSVLIFVLNLIPGIGVILVAIIGIIDSVLAIICAAKEEDEPRSFVCQGISGTLAIVIGSVFYGFQTVVDPANENLVTTGTPTFTLLDEAQGFTVGNKFNMTLPVTATLYKNKLNSLGSLFRPGFFSDENAKKSTFEFTIVNDPNYEKVLQSGTNQYSWQALAKNSKASEPDFRGQTTATGVATLGSAGANTLVDDAYFSTAYAIPGLDCITVGCKIYTERQTFNVKLADFAFDVLPATLDDFLIMTSVGSSGGYSFAWGQNEGLPFPVLRDADGDGLASKAKGGLDPNDNNADSDGDRLGDFVEITLGLDPNNADSDSDGLSDYDEYYYGTNPTLADSDNDGLQDDDEILGWTSGSGVSFTLVRSDPLQADFDQDGYIDSVEKAYGFNPNIADRGDILTVKTSFEEWVDVPAVAPCSTLTINSMTVVDAVRNNDEPLEFDDAEIAVLIDKRRVWYSEGLVDGSAPAINASFPFCDGQAIVELIEIDQGAWSDDPIGDPLLINAGDSGATVSLVSSAQGSAVSLTYSMGSYTNDTVPVVLPSDGYVAKGQDVTIVSQVTNELQVRNALGLASVQAPATWGAPSVNNRPFILPPNQSETIYSSTTVANSISQTGSYDVTSTAGAFFDQDLYPANSVSLIYTPTVHITFDDADASGGSYNNVAPGGTAVVNNVSLRNPSRDANGAFNQAAHFSKIGYDSQNNFRPQLGDALHVTDGGGALALNGGSFTLSSWIRRTDTISSTGAIAGYMPDLDRKLAYPTLYVDDNEIGLYFGNGTTACEVKTNSNPLLLNQWQHVAATFDATSGQAKIFLDGSRILTSSCAQRPTQQSQFWIGRATVVDQVRYNSIYVEQNGKSIGKAWFVLDADGSGDGGRIWSEQNVGDNDTFQINKTVTVPSSENYDWGYTLRRLNKTANAQEMYVITEGDTNNSYVQGDVGDDPATLAEVRTGSYVLGWESGYYGRCDVKGCGNLNITHLNKSMHFFDASLDDIRLYKDAVSEDGVRDIYLSANNTQELRLDEAPGAFTQYDYSGLRNDGYCEGVGCPKAGVPGRSRRAIAFDGINDLVHLGTVNDLRLAREKWSIAGWVYPQQNTGQILATSGNAPALNLRLNGGRPRLEAGGTAVQAPSAIPLNQWTHLAFIRDGSALTIYVNGTSVASVSGASGTIADGPVTLGGNTLSGNTYTGRMDQITIRPAPLEQADVQDLINAAPLVYLPFDEPAGSQTFQDVARRTSHTCSTALTCPTAAQDGQQYGSISLSSSDFLQIDGAQPPTNADWTTTFWVKIDGLKTFNQQILRDVASRNLIDLQIDPSGTVQYGVCSSSLSPSSSKIIPGAWNHIAVAYDHVAGTAALYLNGSLDNSKSVSGCTSSSSTKLEIGRSSSGSGFVGQMDELVVYGASLSAGEIRELFEYEVAWFDSSHTASLIVDVDAPTVALATTSALKAANPNIAITASDQQQVGTPFSGVALVEYQVDGGAWQVAEPSGEVWLFTLDTSTKGSGSYTIRMQATDFVGNKSTIGQGTVVVDTVPPTVNLTSAVPVDDDTVQLDGSAADANGISDVRVAIVDHDGQPAAGQVSAALTGSSNVSWSTTYTTPLPLYGNYDVTLVAIDGPGNLVTTTAGIAIDQTAPTAFLGDIGGTEGVLAGIDSNLPTVKGYAADIPFLPNESLSLQFEETAAPFYDGSPNRNHATCSSCPALVAGQNGQAASFDGTDKLTIANANGLFDSGLDIEGAITIASWVKPAALSGEQVILGRGADANNQVFLRLKNGQYEAGVIQSGTSHVAGYAIPGGDLNQWVHLAAVNNGGEWLLYRNGAIVSRTDSDVGGIVSGSSWTVGAAEFGGSGFSGLIDALFLYPSAVPLNTIAAMADPVTASAVTAVEVGLLHLKDIDTPAQTVWYPALLDQSSALYTTWSLQLPAGIEGPYRISLRSTDADGRIGLRESIWSGEIDTQAPTAILSTWDEEPNRGAFFACDVSDYNLSLPGISCPIRGNKGLSLLEYQDAQWFLDLYSPVEKLKRASTEGGYWLRTVNRTVELSACDLYGNCTTVSPTPYVAPAPPSPSSDTEGVLALAGEQTALAATALTATFSPTTTVRIEQPEVGSEFTSLSVAIPISGFITAENFPVALDVQVNGNSIYSTNLTTPSTAPVDWSTSWTPSSTGIYSLTATIVDNLGNVASDTDTSLTITMPSVESFVGTQPPAIAVDPSVLLIGPGDIMPDSTIKLFGQVSDAVGVRQVEARFGSADWVWMQFDQSNWSGSLPYPAATVADGDSFNLEVLASNYAGLQTTINATVVIDLTAPEPFTPTLSYDDGSAFVPLEINETVTAVSNPTLRVDWTASSDSSGIADYAVSWYNIESDGTLTELFSETTSGTSSSFNGTEGQRILVEITAEDLAGNKQVATAGPVYLDDSLTPAYIDMAEFGRGDKPYRNWTGASCNVLGIDSRRMDLAGDLASVGAQNFYATWNAGGLRLAWSGADWDVAGDLFIYLDTAAGGGQRLHNPYAATADDTIILLPPGMAADYLIWVQDAQTADLLSWNGSAWVNSGQPFTFVHDNDLPQPVSDLLLPFSSLGGPSSLSMVAVASEEDALRLWASMPNNNSLNSESIVPGANNQPGHLFSLTQAYSFADLGSGVCPSSGKTQLAFSANARSAKDVIAYSQLSDGLFFAMPETLSGLRDWSIAVTDLCTTAPDAPLCERPLTGHSIPAALDFDARGALQGTVSLDHQTIGPNETLDIVLDIVNDGSESFSDLAADVAVSGPLQLISSAAVSVPATAPGATTSVTIQVQADASPAESWGSVDIVLYDEVNGSLTKPLEWVFVDVEVDNGAPSLVMLDPSLVHFNQANQQRLFGTYVDQSPVQSITLESGQSCTNESDVYGTWECSSSGPTASPTAGLSATDIFGAQSAFATSPAISNVQDQTAPTLALGLETQAILDDDIINFEETRLNGTVTDDLSAVTVDVCQVIDGDELCETALVEPSNVDSVRSFDYTDQASAGVAIPACSSPLARTFSVSESFTIADLDVGLNLSHPFRNDVLVTLTSAQGTAIQIVSGGTGAANYSLLIDDTATAALSTDYSDHDHKLLFANARRPANEMITALSTENALGTWTLSICDQYPAADNGLYYGSKLFFSARDTVNASSDEWSYELPLPPNTELTGQIIRIYATDQAGNRSAATEFTYTMDTRGPLVTFDTFFSGEATDASGVEFMTIKYHGPDGKTVEDNVTLNGTSWSYPPGLSFDQSKLYAVYIEATDFAGNKSFISAYDYFLTNNPPQANNDNYTTDEKTTLFANAEEGVLHNDSDPDGDKLSAVLVTSPAKGILTLNGNGSFTFDPNGEFNSLDVGEFENATFSYRANDGRSLSGLATVTIRVDGVNDPPDAVFDEATTDEDTPISIDVLANDTDPEDQPLTIYSYDPVGLVYTSTVDLITGTLGVVSPTSGLPELTFDPNGDFETMAAGDSSIVWFNYVVADTYVLTDTDIVSMTITGVNDPPIFLNDPALPVVQYSDEVEATLTVYDVDADALTITQENLPPALSMSAADCGDNPRRPLTCTIDISGAVQVPAGFYTATVSASDGLITTTQDIVIEVLVEDAAARFNDQNPVAVPVTAPGSGSSVPFELAIDVQELQPDQATYTAAAGDINLAEASMTLEPISGGSPISGSCTPQPVNPVTGYDDVLVVTCDFDAVPLNIYTVTMVVDGDYYAGYGEYSVVVYDPAGGYSLGAHAGALESCLLTDLDLLHLHNYASADCDIFSAGLNEVGQNAFVGGDVRSYADIIIRRDATVQGDAVANGTVTVAAGGAVNGAVVEGAALNEPLLPLANTRINGGTFFGNQTVPANGTLDLDPASYHDLLLLDEATVNLRSGVYRFNSITANFLSTINFDITNDEPVIIYTAQDITFETEVMMTANGSPREILFHVAGSQVKLGQGGTYLGTFVAPDAAIDMRNEATLTGALYGSTIDARPDSVINGLTAARPYINLYVRPFYAAAQQQPLALDAGWNMISSHIDPLFPALEYIFAAPEGDDVVLCKDGLGRVYWPAYDLNQIGDWDIRSGYKCYMSSAAAPGIEGTPVVPEQTPINLSSGWSLIAYLRDAPLAIETALNSINGQVKLVKNGAGEIYWPDFDVDQIGDMVPGEGYEIYMDTSAVLTYPAN